MKPCEAKRIAAYEANQREIDVRKDAYGHDRLFYSRLGRLSEEMPPYEPDAMYSRARQVAGTWRSFVGWRLVNALGWRKRVETPAP